MIVRIAALSAVLAIMSFAADVTGKWVASVPGRDGQTRDIAYNLKADGDKLTGTTTGFQGREIELSDGKIDGDNISFKTKIEFNGNTMVMVYKGVVSGDEIKFTQQREGAEQSRQFTAKRAK